VTAHSRDDLLESAQGLRLAAVLEKPISPRSVLDALHQALNQMQHTRPQALQAVTGREAVQPARPLAGLRLLLVEDNDLNQELAATLLNEAGAEVSVATDGQQALDKLRQSTFDLVLMDWKMPRMDGLEATRRLRADPQFVSLPIIAMTSSALPSDREACLQAGMNDHLSKPIDPALLLTLVARWTRGADLGRRATARQAESARNPLSQALQNLVRPLWAELETLVSERDANAISLARPIAHLLHDQPLAQGFRTVASLIEEGDFVRALRELRHLGGQWQLQKP